MTQEALKLALEALKTIDEAMPFPVAKLAQAAIKEALAQPEQEPRNIRERWNIEIDGDDLLVCFNDHEKSEGCHYERYVPATTTPPQRTWVGLTDEEILAVNMSTVTKLIDEPIVCDTDHNIIQLGKAIEAKLKQKNGYSEDKNTRGKND